MKKFLYIISILILLFACKNSKSYKIEGKLSNIDDSILYAMYESTEGNTVDTIKCDKKGHFSIEHEQNDSIRAITFYCNNKKQWFTIYPEIGNPVKINGDAKYPQLLQIKGGRINDKLSEFRRKATVLLKGKTDLMNPIIEKNQSPNSEKATQIANINHELRRIAQDFISKNTKEKASAILIEEYFTHPDEMNQTEELVNMLSPELDDFYIVKDLKAQIEKAKKTQVGAKIPDFYVKNIYGKAFTSNSFANKYFIIVFTALWCDMCQTNMVMIDNIAMSYPKDSLDLLIVSLDDDIEKVRKMTLENSIHWNIVTDSAGQAMNMFEKYNVSSLPKCFLVDKEGIIKLKTENGIELKQTIDELINK